MRILCVFNNSLLASRKIFDRSTDSNLSAKTQWQESVTQGAMYCHLVSYRKFASFPRIMFTEIKNDSVLNCKSIFKANRPMRSKNMPETLSGRRDGRTESQLVNRSPGWWSAGRFVGQSDRRAEGRTDNPKTQCLRCSKGGGIKVIQTDTCSKYITAKRKGAKKNIPEVKSTRSYHLAVLSKYSITAVKSLQHVWKSNTSGSNPWGLHHQINLQR